MKKPKIILLSVLTLGIAFVPVLTRAAPGRAPARAATPPDPRRPVVQWVFTEADLVSCRTAAPVYTLRHLRSRFGGAVELVAVGVGVRPEWGRAFLRTQRLATTRFISVTDSEYRERFTSPPANGFRVLMGDTIVQSFAVRSAPISAYLGPVGESVAELLHLPARAASAPHTSSSPVSRRQS